MHTFFLLIKHLKIVKQKVIIKKSVHRIFFNSQNCNSSIAYEYSDHI